MDPYSILSYYPTYAILDEITSSSNNVKKINFFIDLKNTMQTLYMEHAVKALVATANQSKFVDTSVFSSLMSFLSFHKAYLLKKNMKANFYVFFETGKSYYHLNVDKNYKKSRGISELYGLGEKEIQIFKDILLKNFTLIERACNLIPNIKIFSMMNLEADFIPYYLIKNKLVDLQDSVNIIYSNDHDMLQTLSLPANIFIFSKSMNNKRIIKKNEACKNLLKMDCNFPDDCTSLMMSVMGDMGDDVQGVKNIGPKRISLFFNELLNMLGNMEELYDNVMNGNNIFSKNSSSPNKYINSIIDSENKESRISRNMKLVSFEIISRMVDKPINTEILEKQKKIKKIIESDDLQPKETMEKALTRSGVYLQEDVLDYLYYNK